MRTQADLQKLVNDSGFPLQLALEKALHQEWPIELRPFRSEFPWANGTYGTSGYLDLLVGFGAFRLLISAKRVRDSDWIFLRRHGSPEQTYQTRTYWRRERPRNAGDWSKVYLFPETPESAFAVIPGATDRRALLEREGASLVHALESIASAEDRLAQREESDPGLRIYLPIIVTTARLHICTLATDRIDLTTGEAALTEMPVVEVPAVRFTKAFTRPLDTSSYRGLDEIGEGLERTVFVVQAPQLIEFVRKLNTERPSNTVGPRVMSMQPWRTS